MSMHHQYLKVNPDLQEYVRTVLVSGITSDAGHSDLPLFTKGMPALFCEVENNSCQMTFFGQSIPAEKWMPGKDTTLIAFFFKPFAMGSIFKVSAIEFKEKPIALHLWNAKKAKALNIQLSRSRTTKEKIEILNLFILSQLKINKRQCEIIRHATDRIMVESNADVLALLLDELNLAERTFQRIFKKYVGITPNEYRRICQFYFAFSQLKGRHFDKLADVAYDNDYSDQSHYIRSFKEFTDTTPGDYLQFGLQKKEE